MTIDRRSLADRGSSVVSRSLERYAARGVFRGFSVKQTRRGHLEFRFTWLTPQALTLTYNARHALLTFRNLLPGIGPKTAPFGKVKHLIAERGGPTVPGHKRVDARRVRLGWSTRQGGLSLTAAVCGQHHAYVVQRALNLVNDLFVVLHLDYPDYLTEHFGLPPE